MHIGDVSGVAIDRACGDNPGLTGTIADADDPANVRRMTAAAVAANAPIEILANNSGIGGLRAATEGVGHDERQRTIDIDLSGQFYYIGEVLAG